MDDLIEDAEWALDQALYFTPLLYTDGRISRVDSKIVTGRQKDNAKIGQVLFSDADDAAPDKFKLEPTIAVQSSPGRWHLYWLLDKPHPAVEIAAMNKKLAYATRDEGADLSGAHLTKLLLVPGSHNTKINRATGELVHPTRPIVEGYSTGAIHSMDDFIREYGDVVTRTEVPYGSADMPEGTLDFASVYAKLPEFSSHGSDFNDLVFTEVWMDSADRKIGDRSAARWLLLCELFREGLTPQEVLTVAWHAKSADKWRSDSRGIEGFWNLEVTKALATVELERGTGIAEEETEEAYQQSRAGLPLLTDTERKLVDADQNIITTYCAWAGHRLTRANMPYHRLNAWSLLSAALAECGTLPDEAGDRPLNFFSITVGESATGKGDAKALFFESLEECVIGGFRGDEGINLGGNASPNALSEALMQRDGRVSLLQSDEAHGVFKVMRDQSYQTGGFELWTDLFDGEVPKLLRTGNREVSNKHATTIFNIWFQGTVDGLRKALTRDMFDSGFLGRFIWCIGDPPVESRESMIPRDRPKEVSVQGYDPFVKQMGMEFAEVRAAFKTIHGSRKAPIHADQDALERLGDANWAMLQFAKGHRHSHALTLAQRRMGMSIRKAATLLAIYEQSATVTLRHVLIALKAGEEWFEALVIMAGEISASDYAREVEDIYSFVLASGGSVSVAKLNRAFKDRQTGVREQQFRDLVTQGKLQQTKEGRTQVYKAVEA